MKELALKRLTNLFTAVIGFYFGTQSKKDEDV